MRQQLELVGTNGVVALDDFVLHKDKTGPRNGFDVTHGAGAGDYACDLTVVDLSERREIGLALPQEALMWAAFGRCVQAIRDDHAPPVAQWPDRALLTQEILCALQHSLDEGGKPVTL